MAFAAALFRTSSTLFRSTSFRKASLQIQVINSKRWTTSLSRPAVTCKSPATTWRNHAINYSRELWVRRSSRSHVTAAEKPLREPYRPPTTGPLSVLPASWVPYAELIRIDKPAGTYYLFLPCLFSTLLAAPLTDPIVSPATVIYTSALFFTGALIMRGAGCTVNDLWDRNLDPHVSRTRLRPIARGAITIRQAIPYLGVQLLSGLALLLQFPYICLAYGIPSLLLVATYPLAKRVTNYPQAVLGLTFSWGAMMGYPALGVDLSSNTPALISATCLYGSCVAWTIVYDMIYAYQDIKDDAKAGIKSIALAQEKNAKLFLSAVSTTQIGLLAGAGIAVGAGPVYFLGTCGGAAVTSAYMLWKVNLNSVKDVSYWFFKGAWRFTGAAISLGLFGEYLMHYLGLYEDNTLDEVTSIGPAAVRSSCKP